jgi:protein arginine kinase
MKPNIRLIFKGMDIRSDIPGGKRQNHVVMTTRARIARNLSDFKFNSINTSNEKKNISNFIKETFYSHRNSKNFRFLNISRLNKIQRAFLVERHILSPEMLARLNGKGLIIKAGEDGLDNSLSILINEEDHLRIQSVYPGLNIKKAYREISALEKNLEAKLRFAFDRDFGYLTSCPTNIGTALRVSVIAHLPAMVIAGKIEDFVKNIVKIGCSIRGFYGENSDVVGNLFQISNQFSLGKYEKQILEDMNAICLNIVDGEKEALKSLRKSKNLSLEDSVYRSYGMLKFARMLSYGEALELLSIIKLGRDLDIIDEVKHFNFYQLISLLGESNIILANNDDLKPDTDEVDVIRAGIIRERILKRKMY